MSKSFSDAYVVSGGVGIYIRGTVNDAYSVSKNYNTGQITINYRIDWYFHTSGGGTCGCNADMYCNGTRRFVGSGSYWSTWYPWNGWNSWSTTINGADQTGSLGITVSVGADYNGTSWAYNNASATVNYTVQKYTVTYHTNFGTDVEDEQELLFGEKHTIESQPVRTGYIFTGWNTAQDGSGTTYQPGTEYAAYTDIELYAQWTEATGTLTFNNNTGSGTIPSVSMRYTQAAYIPGAQYVPTLTNYKFLGWSATQYRPDTGTATYQPGALYKAANVVPSNTTLYAVWKLAYIPTHIETFTVERGVYSGGTFTPTDDGTTARVSFSFTKPEFPKGTEFNLTDCNATIVPTDSSSTIHSFKNKIQAQVLTQHRTSVTAIIDDFTILADKSYRFTIELIDDAHDEFEGYSVSETVTIAQAYKTLNVRYGGRGIALGKVATQDGFDINMPTTLRQELILDGSTGGQDKFLCWNGANQPPRWEEVQVSGISIAGALWFWTGEESTIPDGWLECKGQPLSTSSYPELFAAIGYKWGGSGTTFYLPDMRGRNALGQGTQTDVDGASETFVLGETGGSYNSQSHSHQFHSSNYSWTSSKIPGANISVGGSNIGLSPYNGYAGAAAGVDLVAYGTGTSQNLQPYAVGIWIICTGRLSTVELKGEKGDSAGVNLAGSVLDFEGETVPEGWLLCDGRSVSRTRYPQLFDAIGYKHGGSGDYFNLPSADGDYIVEESVNSGDNVWSYRKWASGLAECWCIQNFGTVAITTSWGGSYSSAGKTSPNFPFTFSAIPSLVMYVASCTSYGIMTMEVEGGTTTTRPQSFCLIRPSGTSASPTNVRIGYHAVGRWKADSSVPLKMICAGYTAIRSATTELELNGDPDHSFYAPTTTGSYGQVLTSSGSNGEPTWKDPHFDNYSTDEIRIGTWIDGKPIYRKVYTFASKGFNASTWTTIVSDTSISFDKLIGCRLLRGTNQIMYLFEAQGTTAGVVSIWSPHAENSITGAIIEYTKTTD